MLLPLADPMLRRAARYAVLLLLSTNFHGCGEDCPSIKAYCDALVEGKKDTALEEAKKECDFGKNEDATDVVPR